MHYARCRGTTQQSVTNSINNAERKYYHANMIITSLLLVANFPRFFHNTNEEYLTEVKRRRNFELRPFTQRNIIGLA